MKAADLLIAARKYLSDEKRWTKLSYFRGDDGMACAMATATSACSMGAVFMAGVSQRHPFGHSRTVSRALAYLDAAIPVTRKYSYYFSCRVFNDGMSTTHDDVLAMFDLAIKRARRRHIRG